MGTRQFVEKYPRLLFIDTETTGLDCKENEIIEFAYVIYQMNPETKKYEEVTYADIFIKTDKEIPEKITQITGIDKELLDEKGIDRIEFGWWLYHFLTTEIDSLLGAYNTQFDALFTQEEVRKCPKITHLEEPYKLVNNMIDVLTIYRDRYSFPHKLKNAIDKLQVEGENTHRAIDDIRATYNVFAQLMRNRFNPMLYVNRFGYLKKWGIHGEKFPHIVYIGQGFNGTKDIERYMDKYQKELGEF
jgi:DNA polymerase-3 subunit epsilon